MATTRQQVGRIVGLVGSIAILAAVGIGTEARAADGVKVEGVQVPLDPANGVYEMTGDLIGVWITTGFELGVTTPSGVLTATGTEVFVGCYDGDGDGACGADDPTGEIGFSFQYSGKFDATGALQHGRCNHPVTGGSGDFAGVTGRLGFHDDPSGCSDYKGQLSW